MADGSKGPVRIPAACFLAIVMLGIRPASAQDEEIRLAEPLPDQRVFLSHSEVTTTGKVFTSKAGGEKQELPLAATARFDFQSRRLPPAGRDALALREARWFLTADLITTVSDHKTPVQLPTDRQLIVANGTREGIVSYSPRGPLTREAADLLEIPSDPLVLQAVLPLTAVRLGEDWKPADWVAQMLAGIEAVESSELTCKLEQVTPSAAKITFRGSIKGQRLGTNLHAELAGGLIFNREQNYISQARTACNITSGIGTISPGLEIRVDTRVSRSVAGNSDVLTDKLIASLPLEPAAADRELVLSADQWGLKLQHPRDWHLFQSVYDSPTPVAILRLVDRGSLIAQCNLSPVSSAVAGGTIPLEQFEADIRQSLGKRFGSFTTRENIPTDDGRQIFRVVAEGNVDVAGKETSATVPMVWIYYLVAHPDGRQASFVFSVEPELLEQLNGRDREIASNLRFSAPSAASR